MMRKLTCRNFGKLIHNRVFLYRQCSTNNNDVINNLFKEDTTKRITSRGTLIKAGYVPLINPEPWVLLKMLYSAKKNGRLSIASPFVNRLFGTKYKSLEEITPEAFKELEEELKFKAFGN